MKLSSMTPAAANANAIWLTTLSTPSLMSEGLRDTLEWMGLSARLNKAVDKRRNLKTTLQPLELAGELERQIGQTRERIAQYRERGLLRGGSVKKLEDRVAQMQFLAELLRGSDEKPPHGAWFHAEQPNASGEVVAAAWRYTLEGMEQIRLEITRTDGKLGVAMSVLNPDSAPIPMVGVPQDETVWGAWDALIGQLHAKPGLSVPLN